MAKHKFVDAQQKNKEHPDTFEVPDRSELDSIKKGSIVKVARNNERFWTSVVSVDGDKITATVDNDLICEQPFNYGDIIKFEKRHIHCVWSD